MRVAVTITTTGSAFAPAAALTGGSGATITWAVSGFANQTGTAPSFSFGSAATRTCTMTVTGGGGYPDLTMINLGFDYNADTGTYMPPPGLAKAAEQVSAVTGMASSLTGLVYFLADHTALAGALDFTGCAALQFIQVYGTGVTGVTLTGCTALVRLQCETANLTGPLDLNPVAGNLKDLRAAAQQSGTLTLAAVTSPMSQLYHYCTREQAVVNPVPAGNMPVLQQFWTWNEKTSNTGALAPSSSALADIQSETNDWTSADLTNQYLSPVTTNGNLNLNGCQLTSVKLTGCTGLKGIDLSDNRLGQPAVDNVLTTLAGMAMSNGTLDLRYNTPPSASGTAAAATLTGRGWTVQVDSPVPVSVVQSTRGGVGGGSFSAGVGTGSTIICVVCAFGFGGPMSSTAPSYNFVTAPPGTVLLLEQNSVLNGNRAYFAVWVMPHAGTGSGLFMQPPVANGSVVDGYAIEVAGLGVAPVLDRSVSGTDPSAAVMDSGTTAALRAGAEIVIGASQTFNGSAAGPGAPWTVIGGSSSHGWCGYQVITSGATGTTYDWQQAQGAGAPWAAGIVTVAAALDTGPVRGRLTAADVPAAVLTARAGLN